VCKGACAYSRPATLHILQQRPHATRMQHLHVTAPQKMQPARGSLPRAAHAPREPRMTERRRAHRYAHVVGGVEAGGGQEEDRCLRALQHGCKDVGVRGAAVDEDHLRAARVPDQARAAARRPHGALGSKRRPQRARRAPHARAASDLLASERRRVFVWRPPRARAAWDPPCMGPRPGLRSPCAARSACLGPALRAHAAVI